MIISKTLLDLLPSEFARVEGQGVLELNGASMVYMTQMEGFARSMNYQWIDVGQIVHVYFYIETCNQDATLLGCNVDLQLVLLLGRREFITSNIYNEAKDRDL